MPIVFNTHVRGHQALGSQGRCPTPRGLQSVFSHGFPLARSVAVFSWLPFCHRSPAGTWWLMWCWPGKGTRQKWPLQSKREGFMMEKFICCCLFPKMTCSSLLRWRAVTEDLTSTLVLFQFEQQLGRGIQSVEVWPSVPGGKVSSLSSTHPWVLYLVTFGAGTADCPLAQC